MLPFNVAVTDSRKGRVSRAVSGIDRRSFIQLLAANSAFLAAAKASSRPPYYVGAGYSSDPYTAASVALSACGQFPTNLAGQTVVIKPNLVIGKPSTSGATTDPLVAQAIVDLCLAAGAAQILIVEAAAPGKRSNFGPCGYTAVFQNYPQVQLVDLRTGTYVLHPVPGGGYAYRAMWVPSLVLQPNTFFISAAKLKTHQNAVATLSMKNLVGLASETAYAQPVATGYPRHDLHLRGIDLSIMDLNLVRPIGFAVIDGVWGMEGESDRIRRDRRRLGYGRRRPHKRNTRRRECGAGGPESGGGGPGGAECYGDSPKSCDLFGLCVASGPGAAGYQQRHRVGRRVHSVPFHSRDNTPGSVAAGCLATHNFNLGGPVDGYHLPHPDLLLHFRRDHPG